MKTCWTLRHRYDVAQVDVFSGPAFAWAEAACWTLRRAGKPYVLTLHGGNLPAFLRRWPRRGHRLFRSAAAVTVPSRYLIDELSVFDCGFRLLPNALEIADCGHRIRTAPLLRLGWLRAFHESYNPLLAVRALARLVNDYPALSLEMAGPDKADGSRERVRRAAGELGLGGRLVIRQAVLKREVPAWMDGVDIFLNTSNYDNTPVSVLEAMACGACVVSTAVGGIPWLLRDGHDALLVPAGDAGRMAAAVRRLLEEPGLAARLSRNARAKAEQFDWKRILPEWQSLLLSVARDSRLTESWEGLAETT